MSCDTSTATRDSLPDSNRDCWAAITVVVVMKSGVTRDSKAIIYHVQCLGVLVLLKFEISTAVPLDDRKRSLNQQNIAIVDFIYLCTSLHDHQFMANCMYSFKIYWKSLDIKLYKWQRKFSAVIEDVPAVLFLSAHNVYLWCLRCRCRCSGHTHTILSFILCHFPPNLDFFRPMKRAQSN